MPHKISSAEPVSLSAPGNCQSLSRNPPHALAINEPRGKKFAPAVSPDGTRSTTALWSQGSEQADNVESKVCVPSSGPWTEGSRRCIADQELISDEAGCRLEFWQEYNRLAKQNGLRLLVAKDPETEATTSPDSSLENVLIAKTAQDKSAKKAWPSRLIQRLTKSTHSELPKPSNELSDTLRRPSSTNLAQKVTHSRSRTPDKVDLPVLVRISGISTLYLPRECAPGVLELPTCLSATFQYLLHKVSTKGLFRISGSFRTVNTLLDYYIADSCDSNVSSTVRCSNLPSHIQFSVHDVASLLKRFLSIIPGGILGSLTIFDAMVAIHFKLGGEAGSSSTEQSTVRARLIALAICATESRLRQELICATFGLLSLVGKTAEETPGGDDQGGSRPSPDLMSYHALGVVFGPLLVGDLLDQYTMELATPAADLVLCPRSSGKTRELSHAGRTEPWGGSNPTVNKVLVANDLVEMIASNWREVVRQLEDLKTLFTYGLNLERISLPARPSSQRETVLRPQQLTQEYGTVNVKQLHGIFKAQNTSEACTLSKQLGEARRDVITWRARAGAAEKQVEELVKRVQVLEKLAAGL